MRTKATLLIVALSLPVVAILRAQPPTSTAPAFEVASVKLNTSSNPRGAISGPTPGRFTMSGVPLLFIVNYAYPVLGYQLVGMPDWAGTTNYDVNATYPLGVQPDEPTARQMVQTLLEQRFGLKVHHEMRSLASYALVIARKDGALGPQVTRSDVDCKTWLADKRSVFGAGSASTVAPGGKRSACTMMASRRYIAAGTQTMTQLATTLGALVGRPVIDRTGLSGTFDMDLQWAPSMEMAAPGTTTTANGDGPSIFSALQEQLGLRLDSTTASFDVLVIDHVERPTED
jgi:uncharacterized protein (TIGR03435 family)